MVHILRIVGARWSMTLSILALLLVAIAPSDFAYGQTRTLVYGTELEKQTMTLFVQGDTSMMAWESEAAASKETKQTNTIGLGGWVGESRNVGIIMSSSDTTIPFSLNDSSLRVAQRDIKMKSRIGFIYPTVAATLTEVNVKKAGVTTTDLYATGYGAGIEGQVPLHRMVMVNAEVLGYRLPSSYDKTGQEVALGNRIEGDANLNFAVTDRAVDLLVGYKYKEWSLEVNDEVSNERAQGAYMGLRLGLYF